MIGKLHGTVVDCKNPRELAKFYAELLGYIVVQSEAEWAVIGDSPDRPGIAFQFIENFQAPMWPSGDIPTQIHFDIRVEDFDRALTEVETLGGKLLSKSSDKFWVFVDPEGHPFCIIK
jgi:predicted enzyme related to lactoylglutathione lyase